MPSEKWTGKSYGTPLGYKLFIWVIRSFGLRFSYFILSFVCIYYYLFRPKSRRSTYAFRQKYNIWSHQNKKKLPYFFTMKRIFLFGQVLLDRVAVFLGTKFKLEQSGISYLDEIADSGGIILGSHFGNWEAGLSILKVEKNVHTNVGMSVIAGDFLQKILKQKTDSYISIIALNDSHESMMKMKNCLEQNQILALHGDRHFGSMRTMSCHFMGEEASFPVGPYILAATLHKKICFVSVVKTKWNTYKLTCSEPRLYRWDRKKDKQEQIKQWLSEYVTFLENELAQHPEQWFNFYDFWNA